MSEKDNALAGRLYALAIAKDTANMMDVDASLAMARASMKAIMAISPQAAQLVKYFAQQEIDRLEQECTEESFGSIALIHEALS
jgi:hypothetical protein